MNGDPVSGAPGPVSEALPAPEPERYPFWNYQDLFVLVGLSIPAMIIATVVVRLVSMVAPMGDEVPAAAVLGAQFLTYGIWFLCLYALIRFKHDKPFWPALAWAPPVNSMLRYVLLGPVLAFAVGLAGAALQTPEIEMPMMELMNDRWSLLLMGIFAVSLGPLCEELAFRGFILPLLARSLGPLAGVLITALVFALLHGPQYAWSWRHVLLITAAGAAFGAVRLHTGSTSAATVMHATYNLTFFVAFLAQWEAVNF